MAKSVIEELGEFGQSIWLDNINRTIIEDGTLKKMIMLGLRGMTSNPTIFDKAIGEGTAYDKQIKELCSVKDAAHLYDAVTVADIQSAAEIFMPVYRGTNYLDGYVSLEVKPGLSYKKDETVAEVKRLARIVDRPNVMFKIAATKEGFGAIEECIASGININVTLIFSMAQYVNAANAYINGVRRFIHSGGDASAVRSVASVFVSRIDTMVDKILPSDISLRGKAAVANSVLIYAKFKEMFHSTVFGELRRRGANDQRVLWGSTSTKDLDYSDIKYVTELIGKDTVNTVPAKTFYAFLDHGKCVDALTPENIQIAEQTLGELEGVGVDINTVCNDLLKEGVESFEKSFTSLMNTLREKAARLCQ